MNHEYKTRCHTTREWLAYQHKQRTEFLNKIRKRGKWRLCHLTPPMTGLRSGRFKSWANALEETMKTVYGKVRCQYWNQADDIEAEVDDSATNEQIEAALRDAAIEQAGFEFWEIDSPNTN